jgi:hypothetical protein
MLAHSSYLTASVHPKGNLQCYHHILRFQRSSCSAACEGSSRSSVKSVGLLFGSAV